MLLFFRNFLFVLFILCVTFELSFLSRLVLYLVCLPMYLKVIIFLFTCLSCFLWSYVHRLVVKVFKILV